MLWDLPRIPHAMAKFSQPDGSMISLVTAAELEGSPCEFHVSITPVSLVETALKIQLRFAQLQPVVERMGSAGRHIVSFPAVLLLAGSF